MSNYSHSEHIKPPLDESGNKRPVFADSAYRSVACEAMLEAEEIPSKVHERPYKGKPLTDEQKALNKEKSRVRVRVEHVFGAQALMGMHTIRTIGIERAKIGICLRNLTYNMVRYIQLIAIHQEEHPSYDYNLSSRPRFA